MMGRNMDAEGLLGKMPLDAAVEGKVTTWRDLPDHLLEALGSHVYGNDYLTARLVCQVWRRALSPVTRTVKVHLHHSQLDPATRLLAVQDAFPRACRMAIYVDANTERGGVDLTAACRETLRAMAYTTAPEPAAHHYLSNQQQQPGPQQQQRGRDYGVNTTAARVTADCHMPDGGSDGGPGPPVMSESDMLEHPMRGSCTGRVGAGSNGKRDDLLGYGKLMWQFMSVTVGASVLPLNREHVDPTTHRLMSSGQWVGQQLVAAFAASQSALCNFRHLTTLELTSDTSLFAALLPHLARPGVTPSLTELRFTRAEASRGTLGRWLAVAGAADGARRGGSGEEMAEALDALGSLTGLRSLALNAGLPGLPAAVSRLSHLGFLELHHSGRGVAMVEDVAPLEALTGLTSLKLRYVALRHTWQLTRLTALTGLDLTLRAFYASDGAADGDDDLDDLDFMDAAMEDEWAGAPAQAAAAPAGMDNQGNIGAAAVAAIAPPGGHPAAMAAVPPPQPQLHFEFILPPGQPPQRLDGGASVAPALQGMPLQFLHAPPHILTAPGMQGPLGALQLFQAQAQQQQAAQQTTVQAGGPSVAPAMTLPGITQHPQVPGAWLEPPSDLLLHEHPPHTHNHNSSPNQAQQQTQPQGSQQHGPPNWYLLEPPLEQNSNGISHQLQQQQQQFSHLQPPQLQQLPIFSYHQQQVPSGASPSRPVSTDCLPQQLLLGSAASVSLDAPPHPTSSANLGNAPCSVSGAADHVLATAAAAPSLLPMAPSPTFSSSVQETGSMLLDGLQTSAEATVNNQNGGGGGNGTTAGSRAAQHPGSCTTRAAGMSAVDDVSGRRPACSGGVNEAGAVGGGGKHHAGFGSWMFWDSGRESDSDGAITFSLASSAAGSDWLVDDDGTGKEGGGGNGSASIIGSMGDRLVRRGGADEGRVIHANHMTSDINAAAGGGGGARGNDVIGRISFVSSLGAGTSAQLASVPRELPVSRAGPALRRGDARGETVAVRTCAQVSNPLSAISPPSSSTRDEAVVSAATVLAGMMAPVSSDAPQGIADGMHISPGPDIQSSAFAGPFKSSLGSGSSACGVSGNGDGVVPMELGAFDAEAQHAPCRAVGASFTGTVVGIENTVDDATAAEALQMVHPAAVTAALQPSDAPMEPPTEPAAPIAVPSTATSAADVAAALEQVTAAAVAAVAGGVPDQHGGDGDGAQADLVNEGGMEAIMVQVGGWQPGGADADEEDEEEAEDEDDAEGDEELEEVELALHDAAVSRELWRVVAALPGLKALNVNAWHEAPLDDERLGELAKLSLPLTGQLPVPGLTSLGLLLQAASASSRLSAVSDLTSLKDLTLVVAPPKGTGGRQPPPAAASVQLSTLDIEYDSDDEFDVRKSNAGPPVAGIIDGTMSMHADGEAVMTAGADSWQAYATASAEPRRMAAGGLNADSDTEMEEPSGASPQRHADGAVCALRCSGASGSGGSVGAVAASDTKPANAGDVAVHAAASSSPVRHLAALTSLERLRLYDDPGVLPVDQDAAKLLSRAWSRMNDIYILGAITLQRSANLTFCRLAHLDLFNQTSTVPYRLQLHHLPPSMRALGVQNAVLEGASRATQLQSVLEGLSLYATVHWPTRANGGMDMYDWIAGCSRLASLTIEYDMRTFANIMNGAVAAAGTGAATTAPDAAGPFRPLVRTPLHRLASLPALATLGVFFADSHQDLLAGVLDQRLVDDVAELTFLEELEIWNVYGTDWNLGHIDFSPFARLLRLRSLKMEALPPYMAFRIRRIMQAGVPYCKLRLVADNEMPMIAALP